MLRSTTSSLLFMAAMFPFICIADPCSAEDDWHQYTAANGSTLKYKLVTPIEYDEGKRFPTLIALSSAGDSFDVDWGLERYWRDEARKRGWVVISPEPANHSYLFPPEQEALLDLVNDFIAAGKVEGDRVHFAGTHIGGSLALGLAVEGRQVAASLLGVPGFLLSRDDLPMLCTLKGLPVAMFCYSQPAWSHMGGYTGKTVDWCVSMLKTTALLKQAGARASLFETEEVSSSQLYDWLDEHRLSDELRQDIAQSIAGILDQLHDAASKADGERYFDLFAPDAVFFGTDATERWSIEEFKAFAKPYFDAGTGWTYHVRKRNIFIDDDANTPWFDEVLHNDKYGECRGTGVLVKLKGAWKIVQYNLTIPIPNEIALQVVRMIKETERPSPPTPLPGGEGG